MDFDTSKPKVSLARLLEAESELLKTGDVAPAKHYVASMMRDVVNPLEAINNLVYIMKQGPEEHESARIYIEMIEGELNRLNEIARRTLIFCQEET